MLNKTGDPLLGLVERSVVRLVDTHRRHPALMRK